MATITITGGTGLIGQELTSALLTQGHQVIVLTREPKQYKSDKKNMSYAAWNPEAQTIDANAISRADAIIHLAGANVADKRWTPKRKREILESRTMSSSLLVKALKEQTNLCKVVISASAIGWYGPDPQIPNPKPFLENAPAYGDFLGTTCKAWEESIEEVLSLDKRLVILRTGIVLSNEGGAYKEFKKPIRFGIAAHMGNGKQYVSWIHIRDLVRMYTGALEDERWSGIYNAVAPIPVTNELLVNTIARQTKKYFIKTGVPAVALKAALGEMSIEVLKSCTVSGKKVMDTGFSFFFPSIEGAVFNLK